MNRSEKAQIIDQIKARADRASICVVTDFKGIKVEEITELRVKLREAGVEYAVVKNTLARIATSGGMHKTLGERLKENNAIAFGFDDPVAAAKTLVEYARVNKKFSVRFASLEGKLLTEAQIQDLARLPGKQQLLGMVLGTMNAVPTNFVSLLANVPRGLLNVLTALKDKKAEAA